MVDVPDDFRRAGVRLAIVLLCVMSWGEVTKGQEKGQVIASCENMADSSALTPNGSSAEKKAVPAVLERDLGQVRASSFPELQTKVVNSRIFESSADYFRTRFSIPRFLLLRQMHYLVEINPRIQNGGPSAEGTCAILAHELVHIQRMSKGNRIHLVGLLRLASGSYTARFERSADLEAIRRGYGPGLEIFREWVYKNIPAGAVKRKKRNYFSPEEIAALLEVAKCKPELFAYWDKHVPMTLEEIERTAKNAQ